MKKHTLKVLNLAKDPSPTIKEIKGRGWVKFGKDNNYPQFIIDLLNSSALHNSIITTRRDLVIGNGFEYESRDLELKAKTQKWMLATNFQEEFEKIVYDFEVFGGYAFKIAWAKHTDTIARIMHVPFDTIRSGIANEYGDIEEYMYCADWSKIHLSGYKPTSIAAYNYEARRENPEQLVYLQPYRPGQFYYPLPSYISAQNWIELDSEVSNFHLHNVKNGMNPGFWVNFNTGQPDNQEELDALYEAINIDYAGSNNAGKMIVTFSDSTENAPTFQSLSPNSLDQQFIQLQDAVLQNVLSAHRLTSPMLAGIKTEGQLGGRSEIIEAFELYMNNVIIPDRKIILKKLNDILQFNDLSTIDIIDKAPIQFMYSEALLEKVLTQNELRELMNYEPLEGDTSND